MEKPDFEKGIPLPRKAGKRSKYYWLADMEVGDSFRVPYKKCSAIRNSIAGNRGYWLPDGFKLATQKIDDDEEGGIWRVWRKS
tara:strand:- start:372 stop:620 length:249 start_codon:yes stop_codon:yes gene_type:complete